MIEMDNTFLRKRFYETYIKFSVFFLFFIVRLTLEFYSTFLCICCKYMRSCAYARKVLQHTCYKFAFHFKIEFYSLYLFFHILIFFRILILHKLSDEICYFFFSSFWYMLLYFIAISIAKLDVLSTLYRHLLPMTIYRYHFYDNNLSNLLFNYVPPTT